MTDVRRIGRYDAVVPIGTGGMATVYLARARVADEVGFDVALKLVHPHLRESEDATQTLLEEAKLAARIKHPNVVAVREVGEDASGIYLVMDYVEGATLSKLLRMSGGVPLPIAARILNDVLAGLHAAHELKDDDGAALGLVHRDFSPQNVLVGVDGVTRLTDFGIAKATSRAGVTSAGVVKGKVGYLSPEQALGKPLDRRSDVWAAGIVAWELLAGRRLYDPEAEPVSAMLRIVSETPPRLRSVRPELSAMVEQVVATALALDPSRRWPTAEEMARALNEGLRAEAGIAEPDEVSAWVRALVGDELARRRELVRRHAPPSTPPPAPRAGRRKVAALSALALVSIGVAAFAFGGREKSEPPLPLASALPSAPPAQDVMTEPAAPPAITVASSVPSALDAGAPPRTANRRVTKTPRTRPPSAPRMPGPGPNPYKP